MTTTKLMNPSIEEPSILKRSPLVRFVRWLFIPRILGRLLFALLTLATLIVVYYNEERWRGKQEWQRYKAEMAAKGRSLDFAAFIPPKVPDEQNFAMTPFLSPLYDFLPGTQTPRDSNAVAQIVKRNESTTVLARKLGFKMGRLGRWELGEKTDLITLLGANRHSRPTNQATNAPQRARPATQEQAAEIILDLLRQTYDPVLDELRVASQRPKCRFGVKYDNVPPVAIVLPHLAIVKGIVTKLAWRAEAELVLGRTNQAFEDLMLGLYVSDTVKGEAVLISELVNIACRAILTPVIWDGMAGHEWSDAQLQRLQTALEKDDFTQDAQRALRGERAAFAVQMMEQVIAKEGNFSLDDLLAENTENNNRAKPLQRLVPTGWLYFETINLCRGYESFTAPVDDWRSSKLDMKGFLGALEQADERSLPVWKAVWQHEVLCRLLLPAVGRVQHKSLLAQARSDQIRVACALERHYLAQGSYPEKLEVLTPKFIQKLPLDIMSGRPLIYRRESPQSYVVYSVGKNLVDDGGKVVLANARNVSPYVEAGDWVWRLPGK